MSEAKHTPGPYRVQPLINPPEYALVAADQTGQEHIHGTAVHIATAQLWAVAPDLLEALEDSLVYVEAFPASNAHTLKRVREAIAKAKGNG